MLILALEIAEMVLQKLSDTFLNSFVKEGGLFAINALLMPEKCSQLFPVFSGTQLWSSSSQRSSGREVLRCLCYAFDTGQSSTASGSGTCRHNKDSVHDLAQKIRTTYFSQGSEEGLTDILQKLKTISAALSDLMNMPASNDSPAQNEEKFYCILHEIMEMLNGTEPVSTFEFIESGIVKSLMNYLSNGLYNVELHGAYHNLSVVERRFVVLARLFLSPSNIISEDFPVSVLIQKLQSALSSLENFPVILSHSFRQRNSFATVPYGRCIAHPCLKVRFVKGDGETGLSDFSEDLVTVDPFYSLDVIEGYLWPKVSVKGSKDVELEDRAIDQTKSESLCLPSDAKSIQGESSGPMENESMCTDLPPVKHDTMLVEMQVVLAWFINVI